VTPTFPPDFLDLIIELNRADARYLLVGGHAVAVHGRPRATKTSTFGSRPHRRTQPASCLPCARSADLPRDFSQLHESDRAENLAFHAVSSPRSRGDRTLNRVLRIER